MNLKSIILIMASCLLAFSSCDKDAQNNAPESLFVTYSGRADDVLVANEPFQTDPDKDYEVEGRIKIYKNSFHHVLRFEDFLITNGPRLKVYLSTSIENIDNSIFVGDLLAASGSFNYTFSVNTDLSVYKEVIIRSEDQNSIYSWASF